MAKKTENDKTLDEVLKDIEKQFGKGSIMKLGDDTHNEVDVVSSGSLTLDIALGVGGFGAAVGEGVDGANPKPLPLGEGRCAWLPVGRIGRVACARAVADGR